MRISGQRLPAACLWALSLTVATAVSAAPSRNLTIEVEDGFRLTATYFEAERPGPGVLLLHQCDADRTMWNDLGARLAEAGVHALAIDYRGVGDSKGKPKEAAAFEALDRSARTKINTTDIAAAFDALRDLEGVDNDRIATAGASCGGPRSIALAAEAGGVDAMLLFSTYLGRPALERFGADLTDVPILAVTAEGDGQTTSSLREAFERSTHPDSRIVVYKGSEHGYPLFDQDPDLERVMLRWLIRMLR